MSLEKN